MTPALEALIAEAERLDKGATPGPWEAKPAENRAIYIEPAAGITVARVFGRGGEDARFIARARNLLPDLASALRRAERVVEAARDISLRGSATYVPPALLARLDGAVALHDHPDATKED